MKQLKFQTAALIMVLTISLIIAIPGCKKYEEGNGISLRSRTARVSNTWKVENYKVNDNDLTSLVTNYTETFSKTGDYSYDWGSANNKGTWNFQNNDKEIKLNGNDNQSSRTLYILKLEENTLWYYYMDGNDRNELHLITK